MENITMEHLHLEHINNCKFNCHSVKVYCKDQMPLDENSQFIDSEFPHTINSILLIDKNGNCFNPENQANNT